MTFIYRTSYRMRIWLSFVFVLFVAIASMGIVSYYIAASAAERNSYTLNQEAVNKTVQTLEGKLSHIRISMLSMMVNTNYRKVIGLEVGGEAHNYYSYFSIMQDTFTQVKLIEPLIESILIATPDGDYYVSTQKRLMSYSFYGSDMHRMIMEGTGYHREVWMEQHEDPFFADKQQVITFLTEGALSDPSKNVFALANVKVSKLKEFVTSNLNRSQSRYILLSGAGKEMIRSNTDFDIDSPVYVQFKEALGHDQGQFEYSDGGKKYIVNYKRMQSMNGNMLFSVLAKSEMLGQLSSIKWIFSLIIIGCLLISFLFADLFTRWLLQPVNDLRRLMKDVGRNQLDVRYESKYQDEISQLGNQFNRMLEELRLLFHEFTISEKEKHKAEMRALQAQIDPHFLYNTLNTIYWKSQMNQLPDVQQMVLSLSRMFQLGLNRGVELTTLRNELLHVEQYLTIQQLCYKNLFNYTIEIQDGIDMELRVLKVMLQPLTENCILHGFKDRNTGGFIRIKVLQDEDNLILSVEDNGKGMNIDAAEDKPELSVSAVYGGTTDSVSASAGEIHGGYALGNIRQRLLLQYGGRGGLKVESSPGVYTLVTLEIPRMDESS